MEKYPFYIGKWSLRTTNDDSFKNSNTFLIIKHDDKIKLKTVYFNGIFAIKVSRRGVIKKTMNNLLLDKNKLESLNLFDKNNNIDNKYQNHKLRVTFCVSDINTPPNR
jgi:hypothetical protein